MADREIVSYLQSISMGNYHPELNMSRVGADDRDLALLVQQVIAELIRKNEYYESILDAIPFPMSVTDMNMNWTFINRPTERMLNVSRKDVVGKHCSNWGANICNTRECGIELLRGGKTFGVFEQAGGYYRTNVAYIESPDGDHIGHIEVVTDITDVTRVNNYLRTEIERTNQNLSKLAVGDFSFDYSLTPPDEYTKDVSELFVIINNDLKKAADALSLMTSDALMLAKAAIDGALDTRADASRHQGDFRKIVEGVNDTLDAVIGPLNVAAEYVDRISKGEIPPKITDHYNGDFNEIKNNLNQCIDGLQGLVDANHSLQRMAVNDHTVRMTGSYLGIFAEVANAVNLVQDRVNHIAGSIEKISQGDLSELRDYQAVIRRSDQDRVVPGFIRTLVTLQALVADAGMLAKAAVEGALDTRADASRHQGDYRKIVEGVNDTLDAVIGPLNVAAEYVDRISKGEIPPKITDRYNGDFNEIKNNLNQCIDGLQALVDANHSLQRMAANDHTVRMTGSYLGIFAEVANAVNLVQDRVNHIAGSIEKISHGDLSELGDYQEIKRRSDQDRVVPGFIRTLETLQALVADAGMLSQAAVEGRLATRADITKHHGDYQKIVKGVNNTLDAVIAPVHEALRVSKEYANSNFTARVDPSLQVSGEWIAFKDALNNIGIQISNAVGLINKEVLDLASNAEEATASIEEVSAGAQQIARNAGEVSNNSMKSDDGIIQVLKAMEDLNITVAEVSRRAEEVSVSATEANTYAKNGVDLARKSETAMNEIKRSSSEVDQLVKDINHQMDEIGKIVRLISDIANQTNLLALNAAIEAARAGEAGRGFAVVAAEVKSLAQDSRHSAENITDMITALQNKAKKANEAMVHAGETVELGSASLSETLGAFNQIAASIDDITRNATDVASSSEEQAASVEEVTASINEVSGLVQNTAKEAGDAAAATEEASASIDQISKTVASVSEIVEIVSREMAKFKV